MLDEIISYLTKKIYTMEMKGDTIKGASGALEFFIFSS